MRVKLRHYEKATKLEKKISFLFWQNSCFYSVASKQVRDFFKFLWPFSEKLNFISICWHKNFYLISQFEILRVIFFFFLTWENFLQMCKKWRNGSCMKIRLFLQKRFHLIVFWLHSALQCNMYFFFNVSIAFIQRI